LYSWELNEDIEDIYSDAETTFDFFSFPETHYQFSFFTTKAGIASVSTSGDFKLLVKGSFQNVALAHFQWHTGILFTHAQNPCMIYYLNTSDPTLTPRQTFNACGPNALLLPPMSYISALRLPSSGVPSERDRLLLAGVTTTNQGVLYEVYYTWKTGVLYPFFTGVKLLASNAGAFPYASAADILWPLTESQNGASNITFCSGNSGAYVAPRTGNTSYTPRNIFGGECSSMTQLYSPGSVLVASDDSVYAFSDLSYRNAKLVTSQSNYVITGIRSWNPNAGVVSFIAMGYYSS